MSRPYRPAAAPPGAPDARGAPSPTHTQTTGPVASLARASGIRHHRATVSPQASGRVFLCGSPRAGAAVPLGRRPRDPAPVCALAPTPAQSPRGAAAREEATTNKAPRHRRPRRHPSGRPWPGAAARVRSEERAAEATPARSAPASPRARHDPGLALPGCFLSPFAGGYLWGTVVATPTPILQTGRASIILIINRIQDRRQRLQRMKPIKGKACRRFRKSAKTRRVTQRKPSLAPVCRLCLQEPGDPEKLGEFLQKDNLSVHYFCLILSSKLLQRGQSNRGIHGFLPEDIKKEAARASRKICFVCKKKGAAINCQKDHCVRNFHLPCGQERGCLSQFFGEYKSFCEKHRPTQDIQRGNVGEESCVLCCEDLSQASVENIQSPCCSQTLYHRKCIQKYAHTSAKHFFKCPQCNNREEFPQEMLRMGIHIPDRDAAWELEPGAFSELYQRYQHCDAPICLYEQGRDNFEDEGRWSLVLCATCGSRGTHRDCSFLRSNSKKWECEECAPSPEGSDYLPENSGGIPRRSTFYSGGA